MLKRKQGTEWTRRRNNCTCQAVSKTRVTKLFDLSNLKSDSKLNQFHIKNLPKNLKATSLKTLEEITKQFIADNLEIDFFFNFTYDYQIHRQTRFLLQKLSIKLTRFGNTFGQTISRKVLNLLKQLFNDKLIIKRHFIIAKIGAQVLLRKLLRVRYQILC